MNIKRLTHDRLRPFGCRIRWPEAGSHPLIVYHFARPTFLGSRKHPRSLKTPENTLVSSTKAFVDFTLKPCKSAPLSAILLSFYQFRRSFWTHDKVARSGARTVIVCRPALLTILSSRKHPRITKNHQNHVDLHQNFGEFHLKPTKSALWGPTLVPLYQFRSAFWMQSKVARSGSRTVIVCHFVLSTILGSRKHHRITKNHKK